MPFKQGKGAPPLQVVAPAPALSALPSPSKKLTLLVRAYPLSDIFWDRETGDDYSKKAAQLIERDLVKMGGAALRIDTLTEQARAGPALAEAAPYEHSRKLCLETQSHVLVGARIENEFSSAATATSANWPDLYLSIFDCEDHRKYTHKIRLTPSNLDSFVFAADLSNAANKFLREYRYLYQAGERR